VKFLWTSWTGWGGWAPGDRAMLPSKTFVYYLPACDSVVSLEPAEFERLVEAVAQRVERKRMGL